MERNPDEFHFSMMSSKTHRGGEKVADRGNKALSHDVVKLLKTQDAGYLRMMVQKTQLARTQLQQEVTLLQSMEKRGSFQSSGTSKGPSLAFVDSVEAQKNWDLNGADGSVDEANTHSEDSEEELEDAKDRSDGNRSGNQAPPKAARLERKQRKHNLESKKTLLDALCTREKDLLSAQREIDLQRARMNNSIGGTTKTGRKFKIRERKR